MADANPISMKAPSTAKAQMKVDVAAIKRDEVKAAAAESIDAAGAVPAAGASFTPVVGKKAAWHALLPGNPASPLVALVTH